MQGEVRSSMEPISEIPHKDFKELRWYIPSPLICHHTSSFKLRGVTLVVPWRTRGWCIWSKNDAELLEDN